MLDTSDAREGLRLDDGEDEGGFRGIWTAVLLGLAMWVAVIVVLFRIG
jgi:hypothetical protein